MDDGLWNVCLFFRILRSLRWFYKPRTIVWLTNYLAFFSAAVSVIIFSWSSRYTVDDPWFASDHIFCWLVIALIYIVRVYLSLLKGLGIRTDLFVASHNCGYMLFAELWQPFRNQQTTEGEADGKSEWMFKF